MPDYRIHQHPILPIAGRPALTFAWQDREMEARAGETIAAALFANGVRAFGHHCRDGAPQGIFCANGQCAQCMVVADGLPVKACMTPVTPGMRVEPLDGLPTLPDVHAVPDMQSIPTVEVECLVIGGGPAGLSAAIELGRAGVRTLVVDDKHALGGKLVLQTHKFFGTVAACYAGMRGVEIAARLAHEVAQLESVQVWLNTTALAVFSDRKVGILREGRYVLVHPHVLLVATGAREKSLVFPGNALPGVYGAGAFQTLANRDLVRPAERLFIVGGGNVGLIAGYHALQAGIAVAGLCEALPDCSGYKVHRDKLARLGVPVFTSHTILSANGTTHVESVTIARLGADGQPLPGTERTFACDAILVAVGLDPVDEFVHKAREFGLPVYAAGDAEEITEASAAMFGGRIRGLEIARALGRDVGEVPPEWRHTAEILKSRPGAVVTEDVPQAETGVFPVFHCVQEIPCNPCTTVCPRGCIAIEGDGIGGIPEYVGEGCTACGRCVVICPGLAITLLDYRADPVNPIVTVPYEFLPETISEGNVARAFQPVSGQTGKSAAALVVTVLDTEGAILGEGEVVKVHLPQFADRTSLVRVRAPREIAHRIAGIRPLRDVLTPCAGGAAVIVPPQMDEIVCRCERVTASEIRALMRAGYRDMNALKAATRAGMGACGGKTCANLIKRLFREEGVPPDEVIESTRRPLFVEAPLGAFAGVVGEGPAEKEPASHATDAHEGGL